MQSNKRLNRSVFSVVSGTSGFATQPTSGYYTSGSLGSGNGAHVSEGTGSSAGGRDSTLSPIPFDVPVDSLGQPVSMRPLPLLPQHTGNHDNAPNKKDNHRCAMLTVIFACLILGLGGAAIVVVNGRSWWVTYNEDRQTIARETIDGTTDARVVNYELTPIFETPFVNGQQCDHSDNTMPEQRSHTVRLQWRKIWPDRNMANERCEYIVCDIATQSPGATGGQDTTNTVVIVPRTMCTDVGCMCVEASSVRWTQVSYDQERSLGIKIAYTVFREGYYATPTPSLYIAFLDYNSTNPAPPESDAYFVKSIQGCFSGC